MSRTNKFAALATVIALSLATGACNTAKPAPQMGARTSLLMNGAPTAVLQSLRGTTASQGGQVTDETVNSMAVDFGVQTMRIPIPTEYGLWGTRVSWRDTEVHSSAFYWVEACEGGTRVTVLNNPIYWHPDYKSWLPGPFDVSPGFEALTKTAGVQ